MYEVLICIFILEAVRRLSALDLGVRMRIHGTSAK